MHISNQIMFTEQLNLPSAVTETGILIPWNLGDDIKTAALLSGVLSTKISNQTSVSAISHSADGPDGEMCSCKRKLHVDLIVLVLQRFMNFF
jgi:hypothetical protein